MAWRSLGHCHCICAMTVIAHMHPRTHQLHTHTHQNVQNNQELAAPQECTSTYQQELHTRKWMTGLEPLAPKKPIVCQYTKKVMHEISKKFMSHAPTPSLRFICCSTHSLSHSFAAFFLKISSCPQAMQGVIQPTKTSQPVALNTACPGQITRLSNSSSTHLARYTHCTMLHHLQLVMHNLKTVEGRQHAFGAPNTANAPYCWVMASHSWLTISGSLVPSSNWKVVAHEIRYSCQRRAHALRACLLTVG
ncbi:hypothetical protein DUNSADRAFT_18516 [Dunaliella salina]|uniref:Secreted protein n=1 Tax=Dunaliella salina TaxID=3046 RepID=A0ABQ7G007_DUNSA|nr:hypothetical protein DUNSADRAFT_18516 [Dunaliella salina]|eukprot:KAF5827931.1 hypothetical protein DUNSADRAFT_18516 [Dunaliella salina]